MKQNAEEGVEIKYDKRKVKALGIMAMILTIIFALPVLLFFILSFEYNSFLFLFYMYGSGFGWLVLIFALVCLVQYENGKSYLKGLEKMGYLVPERAADYEYALDELPRNAEWTMEKQPEKDRMFLIISGVSGLIGVGFFSWLIRFYLEWGWEEEISIFVFLLTLLNLFWIYQSWKSYQMSKNEKYRSEFDGDLTKKKRGSWIIRLSCLLVIALVQMMGYTIVSQFVSYVYEMDLGVNHKVLTYMGMAIAEEYAALDEEEKEVIYAELQQGMDMDQLSEAGAAFINRLSEKHKFPGEGWREGMRHVNAATTLKVVALDGKLLVRLINVEKKDGKHHHMAEVEFSK